MSGAINADSGARSPDIIPTNGSLLCVSALSENWESSFSLSLKQRNRRPDSTAAARFTPDSLNRLLHEFPLSWLVSFDEFTGVTINREVPCQAERSSRGFPRNRDAR